MTGFLCRQWASKCVEWFFKSSVSSFRRYTTSKSAAQLAFNFLTCPNLGLWLEAAELIWASLVGFYALPQPDKKVILKTSHQAYVIYSAAAVSVVFLKFNSCIRHNSPQANKRRNTNKLFVIVTAVSSDLPRGSQKHHCHSTHFASKHYKYFL